ncbi:metal ABC transporter ATP-binding protein [Sinomonas susongensis]|uniref:metal ABC transporter ATP-binding protein n=1 Tax=Sinomonas susongensis TaxID=1324851 RepID=UPI001BB29078|nr:ABC transporter ATP-binding protein [Sinomonas susongensis]
MSNDSAVRFRGVSATVGGRTVWSGVDFTVDAGQFAAVLGPNGVGKTTLLKAILGLVPTSAGTISVFGHRPGADRSRIGYLPQRHAFGPSVRIRGIDIVRLGLDGERWGTPLPSWLQGSKGRAAAERVREVIRLVGAESYAHRPVGQCSGGEQQRLLIAQALVRRPDLLILDEPLDSLDVTNQRSVSALIQSVCRREGIAVVMVAHDVNPILPYLDRVIYLGHGGAVTGAPEQVITPEALTALYGTPVDVLRDRMGRLVVVGQPDAPPEHPHDPEAHA